jgi:anti-sigma factor RsiW
MSARIVNLGSSTHQNVQDLLPWFVMGTLDDDDRRFVDEHLRTCAACLREVQWHENLREAHDEPAGERNVDHAFAALRARLQAPAAASASSPRKLPRLWPVWGMRPWAGWALAFQSLIILGLAGMLVFGSHGSAPSTAAEFHALGRPGAAAAAARLVIVFTPQASEAEMRRVLVASGARIVDGPTAADAYILAVAPERADQALQQLRAERSVLLIQSLDAGDLH